MSLDIDFATRSRFTSRGVRVLGAAIAIAALAVALSAVVMVKNRRLDQLVSTTQTVISRRQPVAIVQPIVDAEEQKGIRRASAELHGAVGQNVGRI